MKLLAVVSALLCAQVIAGPVGQYQPGQCANLCKPNSKFDYEIGHTYEYEYNLENKIGVNSNDESKLNLKATVLITPQTSCEFVLQLRDVQVAGDYGNLATDLQRFPLTFAFQDGKIEEVCPSIDEKQDILNIKRGILSSLQNSMYNLDSDHDVQEVDVSGECEAQYSVYSTSWGGTKTIIKKKDLNACKDRSTHMAGIHGVGYHIDSDYQGLPIIKSSHTCEQVIDGKLIHKSTCDETHTLRPFSSDSTAATSKSTQILSYRGKTTGQIIPQTELSEKTDLLFNHLTNREDKEAVKNTAISILDELAKESKQQVTPRLASKFSHLVATLRKLPFTQLRAVYKISLNDPQLIKFLLDALPVVGTGASISMMHEAIQNGLVEESEADMWYTSLAFTNHPTIDMLEAALPLLGDNYKKQVMLGVSSLLHKFCAVNTNCGEYPEVKSIVRKLESNLGSACRATSRQEEDLMMVSLKAIGNAGVVSNERVLNQCFMEETNSMRVRVAALEAYRRMPCSSDIRQEAMRTFRDVSKDSELRIATYLTVMRCVSPEIVAEVKEILSSEPVNQVGSFVWTHLTNLQETSDPVKVKAKELLANDFLRNKFNSNALKFSRNYEMSLFSQKWNIGSQVESNVIFSKSPIPRSMNYNFTVNLFGESFNLFEIGSRVEGFESFLARFFGPSGYFPEEHVQQLLETMSKKHEENDDVTRLSNENVEPTLDAFLRVFGNELSYGSFKSFEDVKDVFGEFDPFKVIRDLMNQREIDYTKASHFINAQFTVPTSSGLPLSVNLNGTALLRLNAKGDLQSNSVGMDISGKIKPSAAVELTTLMSVDAGDITTGIQVLTTLHTSTVLDAGFAYQNGKIMNVHVNMPEEKQEVITVDSKVFLVSNQEKRELSETPHNLMDIEVCTGEITSRPLGVQLCGEIGVDSGFPLNGPAHASIYLEKTDEFNQYLFEIQQSKNENYYSYGLTLDTPNSRVNRRNVMSVVLDYNVGQLNGKLETPFKTFGLTGKYKYEPIKKLINLVGTSDNEEIFALHGSLNKAQSPRRGSALTIKPEFNLSIYKAEIAALRGSFDSSDSGKASMDLTLSSMFLAVPVEMRGNINSKYDKKIGNAILKMPMFEGEISGQVASDKFAISSTYQIAGEHKETFDVSAKYSVSEKGEGKLYGGTFGLMMSTAPEYNIEGEIIQQIYTNGVEGKIRLEGLANFEVNHKLEYVRNEGFGDAQAQLDLRCLKTGSSYGFIYSQKGSVEASSFKLSTATGSQYDFSFTTQLTHRYSPLHYGADVNFKTSKNNIKLMGKLVKTADSEFDSDLAVEWTPEYKMKVSGKLTNSPQTKQATLFVKLPRTSPVQIEGSYSNQRGSLAAMAQVQYEGQQYFASLDYMKSETEHQVIGRLTTPSINNAMQLLITNTAQLGTVALDISCSRHITANASWSKTSPSLEVEAFWDKARDHTKRIIFSATADNGYYKLDGTFLEHTLSASVTKRKHFLNVLFDWGQRVDLTIDTNDKIQVILTTPFEGYKKQSLVIAADIQNDYIFSEIGLEWADNKKLGIKLEGRLNINYEGYALNAQLDSESTSHPFINGLSISYDAYATPKETRNLFKILHQGDIYQTSYNIVKQYEGKVFTYDAKLEVLTPNTRTTGNVMIEYDGKEFHYKQTYSIPTFHEHKFEIVAKYQFLPMSYYLDSIITYSGSYFKPTHMILNVQKKESKLKAATSLAYGQEPIFDIKSKASVESSNTISGTLSGKIFNNVFEGIFEHNIALGPTSVINSKFEGSLNGKKVNVYIDGKHTSSPSSKEIYFVSSLSSPWETYNDWKVTFQHSVKNRRYQTTLTINKGTNSASINQDLSVYNLANFEHKLSINSPYEDIKYITINTKQNWDENNFKHDSNGIWNDKSIATSANFNRKNTKYGKQLHGDANIQTPFSKDIKASLNHEYDGTKYNPTFRVDYGENNLISLEAGGFFESNKLESKIRFTLPQYRPVTIRLAADIQSSANFRGNAVVEYGENQRVEYNLKAGHDGRFQVVQWFWEYNSQKTEQYIKYNFSRTHIEGEYFLNQPDVPSIKAYALIEKLDDKQNIHITGTYGTDKYEISATTVLKPIGKISVEFSAPLTHKNLLISYDYLSSEKTLNGLYEDGTNRHEIKAYMKTAQKNGDFNVNVETTIAGYEKLALKVGYTNEYKDKAFKLQAQINNQVLKVKGKLSVGLSGDVSLSAVTPFYNYNTINLKGTYNLESEEKSVYINGNVNDQTADLSLKGKFSSHKIYIIADVSTPFTEKQHAQMTYELRDQNMLVTGDWNDERMEIESSYSKNKFIITAIWRDQKLSLFAQYDETSGKLGFATVNESFEVDGYVTDRTVHLIIKRNDDEVIMKVEKLDNEFSVNLRTPFQHYQNIHFVTKYDHKDTACFLSAQMTQNEETLFSGIINLYFSNTAQILPEELTINIKLPIKGYENLQFSAKLDSTQTLSEVMIVGVQNQVTLFDGKISLHVPTYGEARLKSHVMMPLLDTDASLIAEYNINLQTKTANIEVSRNDAKFTAELFAELGHKESIFTVKMTTPCSEHKKVYGQLALSYGNVTKYAKLTTGLNDVLSTYGVEVTFGAKTIAIRFYSPIPEYEDIMVTGEYTLDPTEKFLKLAFTHNGQIQEINVGGRYDDDMAESKLYINTPVYQRSLTGRVRRSLDLYYSDNYVSNDETRVIEVSGSLAATKEEGKIYLKAVTPFDGWKYTELSFNYNLKSLEKFFNAELTNGEKTYKYSGQAEISDNIIKGAIQTQHSGYEQLSFSLEHELFGQNKFIRLSFDTNGQQNYVYLRGEFDALTSYGTVTVDTIYLNGEVHISYDVSQQETLLSSKVVYGDVKYEIKLNTMAALNGNTNVYLSSSSDEININIDHQLMQPVKTIKVNYSVNGHTEYFIETSLALLNKQIEFELQSSVNNFENIAGKAEYDFETDKKNVQVMFSWNKTKYELTSELESSDKSAEIMLNILTPIQNYNNIKLNSKLNTQPTPSIEIKFSSPSTNFNSLATYNFGETEGRMKLEIASNIRQIEDIRIDGNYNLGSVKKVAEFTFTRNREEHRGNVEVMYQGTVMNGNGYVKLNVPFLTPVDAEITTRLSPSLKDSELTIRFGKYNMNLYANMETTNGYLKFKSDFENFRNTFIEWNFTLKNNNMEGMGSVTINDYKYIDINTYIYLTDYSNINMSLSLDTPYIKFNNAELSLLLNKPTKFQIEIKIPEFQEHKIEVELEKYKGSLKLYTEGATREPYNFDIFYTLTNKDLNVDIKTPFLSPINVNLGFYLDADAYNFVLQGTVGKTSALLKANIIKYNELEIEANLPFQGFEHLYGLFKISYQQSATDVILKIQKDEDVISLEQTLIKKENRCQYYARLLTPFVDFEETQLDMSLDSSLKGYEGEITFEYNQKHISGRYNLVLNDMKKTSLTIDATTPFEGYTNLKFDTSFIYNESMKYPQFVLQFEREYSIYSLSGHVSIEFPQYTAMISIKTPLETLKDISLTVKYNAQQKHHLNVNYVQNNIKMEVSGEVFITSQEGDIILDVTTNLSQIEDVSFQSSYNFVSSKKKLSASLSLPAQKHLVFDAKWNYGTATFASASLKTPWTQPNFDITIEGDLKPTNKNAVIKFESNDNVYEMRYERIVDEYSHRNSLTIQTPTYSPISFRLTVSDNSVRATAEYGPETIDFSSDYSYTNNAYSLNAFLKTPFTNYENIEFKSYFKSQNEFAARGSLSWASGKKIYTEMYMSQSKVTFKFDSPYSPYKNVVADFTFDKSSGYKLHGIISWETKQMEINSYLSKSSINIDINTPFDPFTDMHLEGTLKSENNEFGIAGYGKWQEKKVKVNGSFFVYKDFGIKTNLEVKTPIVGHETYALYLDIKKPMSQEGIDASVELRSGDSIRTATLLLTHNGLTDFDVVLTVLQVKSSLSFKLNRDVSAGNTEVKLNGSLPFEYLPKFAFYGNIVNPSSSKLMVNLELQTKSEVNKFYGNYAITDNEIKAEVSADLPLIFAQPIRATFNLKHRSFKNFNVTGVIILPQNTYEIHSSFVIEKDSVRMLFKESGFYNLEAEIETLYNDGIVFNANLYLSGSKHSINGTYQKSNTGIEVRGEASTPLLSNTVGFKVATTYKDNLLDLIVSLKSESTYIMRGSYTSNEYRHTVEIMYEVSGTRKLLINAEYEPYEGMFTVTLPSGIHQLTFSLKKTSKKASFVAAVKSPLLSGNYFEVNFNFKNDGTTRKVSLKITNGTETHTIMGFLSLDEVEKKLETKIETPLFNLKKIKLNSYLTKTNDMAEGEVLVNLPNETHSLKAVLSNNMRGEFRIKSPWLPSQQILITTQFENSSYKRVLADISMKNGEQKLQLTGTYDISDPSFYQASITVRSSFYTAEFIELSGNLRTTDRISYELKFDSKNLSKFLINGEYLLNSSLFNISVNLKSPIKNLSLYLNIPFTQGERMRIVFDSFDTKYELSGHINFKNDKISVDGSAAWNGKEISGSLDASYENPAKLRVSIKTPFQGYERLNYNGKLFWDFSDKTAKNYKLGLEWNEKVLEFRSILDNNILSIEVITPFNGFKKSEIEVRCNESPFGRSMQAVVTFAQTKYGVNLEYSVENLKQFSAKIEIITPYRKNYYGHISSKYDEGKYKAHLVADFNEYHVDVTCRGVLRPNEVTLSLEDTRGYKVYGAVFLNPNKEISGEYALFMPNIIDSSGRFSATAVKTEDSLNYGISFSYKGKELFEVNVISEYRKVIVTVINPFYPVSLKYTYDNTPQTFEIEGEFCWDLNKRIESTVGGNLLLQNTDTGGILKVKVAAPHHQARIYTNYHISNSKLEHVFNVGGVLDGKEQSAGYALTLEKDTTSNNKIYHGIFKVDYPNYPVEVSFQLNHQPNFIFGNVELIREDKNMLNFEIQETSNNTFKGKSTIKMPYVGLSVHAEGQAVYLVGKEYGLSFDIREAGSDYISFRARLASNESDNTKTYHANMNINYMKSEFDFNSDVGSELDKYYARAEYALNQQYNEYFVEYYASHKFRAGKTNVFLIEGSLMPVDSGYKGSLKGQYDQEEYEATVWADNEPAFIEVNAKHDNQNILNARFDATDMLSTKVYLQPSLFFDVQDVLTDFL